MQLAADEARQYSPPGLPRLIESCWGGETFAVDAPVGGRWSGENGRNVVASDHFDLAAFRLNSQAFEIAEGPLGVAFVRPTQHSDSHHPAPGQCCSADFLRMIGLRRLLCADFGARNFHW